MKTYSLCRRGSSGRNVVLYESSNKEDMLLHFAHALDFNRLLGYEVFKVVLNDINSYFLYGNNLFTAKVFIL